MLIIVLVAYLLACLGAGLLLLKLATAVGWKTHPASTSPALQLATGFLLGLGLLNIVWTLLALAGRFSSSAALITILVCLAGLLWAGASLLRPFDAQVRRIYSSLRADSWGWQAAALLGGLFFLFGAASLGAVWSGDASAFYMTLAKLIATTHSFSTIPGYESFMEIGLFGELHLAALLTLGSADAAKLSTWAIMPAGLISLAALTRAIGGGRRAQTLAVVMALTSSAVIWIYGNGKVDLFAAVLGLGAYYWAFESGCRVRRTRLALALAGLLTGWACLAKISYLPAILPGVVLLVAREDLEALAKAVYRRDSRAVRELLAAQLKAQLQLGLWALAAFSIHFLRVGLLYNTPLAPFFGSTSGGVNQVWFTPATTGRILLTYPFALTYGSYWAQAGNLSPLILAFFPLLLIPAAYKTRNARLLAVLFAALVGTIAWAALRPSVMAPRYILSTLLLFAPPAACAAEAVSHHETRPRLLGAGVIFFTHVILLATFLYYLDKPLQFEDTVGYLKGELSECDRDIAHCHVVKSINNDAPPGARVFARAYFKYWMRGDLLQCASQHTDHTLLQDGDSEAIWMALYQRGFDYLYLDESTHAGISNTLHLEDPPAWVQVISLNQQGLIESYRLDYQNPPIDRLTTCQETSPDIWAPGSP